MDETMAADRSGSDPPAPAVKRRRGISIVWVIPIVAALIGGFLAYRAYTEKGPTITLSFETAEGLEAGKTKVRYLDVEVGTVQTVAIAPDLKHIIVTADMVPGAENVPARADHLLDRQAADRGRRRVRARHAAVRGLYRPGPGRGCGDAELHGPGAAAADRRQRGRPAIHADRREPGLAQPGRPDLLPRPRHRPGPGPPARPRRAEPGDLDLRQGALRRPGADHQPLLERERHQRRHDDLGHRRPGRLAAVADRRRDRVRQSAWTTAPTRSPTPAPASRCSPTRTRWRRPSSPRRSPSWSTSTARSAVSIPAPRSSSAASPWAR